MPHHTTPDHVKPYVQDTLTTRALHFSMSELQSRMDLRDPDALELEYTRLMMGFLLFVPAPAHLAMIGLGGGSLAKFCHKHLARTRACVVEINPHVIALREAFNIPPDSPRFQILQADGAAFVRQPPQRFEVLLVDGFDYDGLPAALSSQRFYDDCADTVAPGGVMVANLHLGHAQYAQQLERIRRSFAGAVLAVHDSDGSNAIVFACKGDALVAMPNPLIGPLRRPKALSEAGWRPLQAPFARITSALQLETGQGA